MAIKAFSSLDFWNYFQHVLQTPSIKVLSKISRKFWRIGQIGKIKLWGYFRQNFHHTFCRSPSLVLDFSLISHFFYKHFSEMLRIILSGVGKCQLQVVKNLESRHHLPLFCDFQHQKQQMTLVSLKCIFMLLSFLVQQDTYFHSV